MSQLNVEEQQAKDREDIIRAYRSLMRSCYNQTSKSERKRIRRAFEYANDAHRGARRKSGVPYILHPIAVAKITIKEIGLGPSSVICALLHDVVEDTSIELSDIKSEFGGEVARIVGGLTKISGFFDHQSSAQAENFRKMLLTLSDDVRVILIKLADRLHNMQTLQHMKKENQLKISSETLYLYAPLAHRLGLNNIKHELEDLALKFTQPDVYQSINTKLKKIQRESQYYIKKFMGSVREQLTQNEVKFHILNRYKSIYSIYSKMMRQEIPFEEVYDLFAIRIIFEPPKGNTRNFEKSETFRIFALISEKYRYNPERFRDWITAPKTNGYEALHITVMGPRGRWIEVQIRSERMDRIAERGVAAHWKYKEGGQAHDEIFANWLGRVRELLENPALNAIEVVQEFKTNLVIDEVFVFTPKGELIRLPLNSTVLDFAYEIHSGIGDSCIGAKVNHKVVPLSYTLQSGDQVEIITSKKQQPRTNWLEYANTSKAKNRIKEGVKRQRKEIAAKGEDIFKWKAKNYDWDRNTILRELQAFFKVDTEQEFFYQLGEHKLDMDRLQEFIRLKEGGGNIPTAPNNKTRKRLETLQEFEGWLKENRGENLDMLMIGEDMDISDYEIGSCCTPVDGDDVLGFFSPKEGLVIHRTHCKKAISMMSTWGKNIIKVKWAKEHSLRFLTGVRIIGSDRQGMMNDLIQVISANFKLNIRSISIDSNDGMFEGVFRVFVKNTGELELVQENLLTIEGVHSVSRMVTAT